MARQRTEKTIADPMESTNGDLETLLELMQSTLNWVEADRLHSQLVKFEPKTVIPQLLKKCDKGVPHVDRALERLLKAIPSPAERSAELSRLAEHLAPKYAMETRLVAVRLLAKFRHERSLSDLLKLARSSDEAADIRRESLKALRDMSLDAAALSLLVDALASHDLDFSIFDLILGLLESHQSYVPYRRILTVLESYLQASELRFRCRAIESLGVFGELDVLERVCMLPAHEEPVIKAIQQLTRQLLTRPRNVLYLRPEHFEHLILRLVERLGYERAEVKGQPHDQGIDVECWKSKKDSLGAGTIPEKYIIQCKRYRERAADEDVVEALAEATVKAQARHGLLIVTSQFTRAAQERARRYPHLTLYDGVQLQKSLDECFEKGTYCARIRQ